MTRPAPLIDVAGMVASIATGKEGAERTRAVAPASTYGSTSARGDI
jgi:hypothetical protein